MITDNAQYAQKISEAQPDVLLAPLDDSATSRSKCFNKYLEISAAGSAGIYTGIPPYTEVVRDNFNGLLIDPSDNEKAEAWLETIDKLYKDRNMCRTIAGNALEHVKANFDTRERYKDFLSMIRRVIQWGREDFFCA